MTWLYSWQRSHGSLNRRLLASHWRSRFAGRPNFWLAKDQARVLCDIIWGLEAEVDWKIIWHVQGLACCQCHRLELQATTHIFLCYNMTSGGKYKGVYITFTQFFTKNIYCGRMYMGVKIEEPAKMQKKMKLYIFFYICKVGLTLSKVGEMREKHCKFSKITC